MNNFSEKHHEFIREVMQTYPEVREGRMFGYPVFFVGRRMFACIYGDGVGLKLPAEDVRRLLAMPGIAPFQPHGRRRMREWVQIDRQRSSEYALDIPVLEKAIRYASDLCREEEEK